MITDRDHEIVEQLDLAGGLDMPALQLMFDVKRQVMSRRLVQLEGYGMVTAVRPFARAPAIYVPSYRGLRVMLGREDLNVPSVSPGSYVHQQHVAHAIAELQVRGVRWQGSRALRREHRAAEAAGDRVGAVRYSIKLSWLERRHLPDVLFWPSETAETTGQPVALEVELAQKSRRRLDEILLGYATSLDVAGVVYVCGPAALPAVTAAVKRMDAHAHMVQVVSIYDFGSHFGPPKTAPSARRATETQARIEAPERSWLDETLTAGPISLLEQRLRGDQTAAAPLPL